MTNDRKMDYSVCKEFRKYSNRSGKDGADGICGDFQSAFGSGTQGDLVLLKKEKLSAGEIGKHFEMTGATISYHLKILKKADLIRETKYKNFIYYELNISVVEEADARAVRLGKGIQHYERK